MSYLPPWDNNRKRLKWDSLLVELRKLDSFISVWTENRAVAVLLVGQSFNPLLCVCVWGGGMQKISLVSFQTGQKVKLSYNPG